MGPRGRFTPACLPCHVAQPLRNRGGLLFFFYFFLFFYFYKSKALGSLEEFVKDWDEEILQEAVSCARQVKVVVHLGDLDQAAGLNKERLGIWQHPHSPNLPDLPCEKLVHLSHLVTKRIGPPSPR